MAGNVALNLFPNPGVRCKGDHFAANQANSTEATRDKR